MLIVNKIKIGICATLINLASCNMSNPLCAKAGTKIYNTAEMLKTVDKTPCADIAEFGVAKADSLKKINKKNDFVRNAIADNISRYLGTDAVEMLLKNTSREQQINIQRRVIENAKRKKHALSAETLAKFPNEQKYNKQLDKALLLGKDENGKLYSEKGINEILSQMQKAKNQAPIVELTELMIKHQFLEQDLATILRATTAEKPKITLVKIAVAKRLISKHVPTAKIISELEKIK